MTVDELIAVLASQPGDLQVGICVVSQQGSTYDPITADATEMLRAHGCVWLTGIETGGVGPTRVTVTCHCGIEHEIDTASTVCDLPTRDLA